MYKANYKNFNNKPKTYSIFWQIILPTISVLVLFVLSGFLVFLPLIRETYISREKSMIKNATDIAISSIQYFKKKSDLGELTESAAKEMALNEIENYRYGDDNKEYFFIIDNKANMLMHPYYKDSVGVNFYGYKDSKGNMLFNNMVEIALNTGSGYVSYYWQLHDNAEEIVPKTSYVAYYKPWKWVIGTGLYLDWVEDQLAVVKRGVIFIIIIISLITGIICFWIIKYSLRLQKVKFNAESETYESIDFLKKLIDNIPGIIYTKDLKGRYILVNQSFQRLVEKDLNYITGKNDLEIFDEKYATEFMLNDAKVMQTGELLRCEEKLYSCGAYKTYLSLKFPLKDINNEISGVCGVSTDITDIITMQDELKTLNENLEKKVEERTFQVDQTNKYLKDSLEKLQTAQKQLIEQEKMASLGGLVAGVAHEINTPIGIGITAVSNLQEKLQLYRGKYESNNLTKSDFDELMNISNESLDIVYKNLRRAVGLISSFKQIAVDQTSEDFRTFDIKEYIDELIVSLKPKLKKTQHEVEVICESGVLVFSCPGAISQIFTNLIMNSVLHGFENIEKGRILIKIETDPEYFCIEYNDNGSGMNSNTVDNIFEPFFTTKRGVGGSGLGMNLVYNIITQKLKGLISCESELGKGCVFRIKLPRESKVYKI